MAFMEPFIYRGRYYVVESNHGERTFLPEEVEPGAKTNQDLAMYVEGTVDSPDEEVEVETGILGRLSAPGYLDCTPWSPYDSEDEALADLQGDDDDDDDDDESEDDNPQEEDLVTEDHCAFWAHGMSRPAPECKIISVGEGHCPGYRLECRNVANPSHGTMHDSVESALRAFMDGDQYWPNCWWISDHGNAHRIDLSVKG